MDPHTQICTVVSHEIAEKLTAHKEKEREHVEALLASQKHLTSNVRTLINSLDQVLALSSPKFSSNQPDLLRSVVSRARLLQEQLDVVSVRMQRMQVHVRGCEAPVHAPGHQQRQLPQQRQEREQPVGQQPQ